MAEVKKHKIIKRYKPLNANSIETNEDIHRHESDLTSWGVIYDLCGLSIEEALKAQNGCCCNGGEGSSGSGNAGTKRVNVFEYGLTEYNG